jgi:hypothetical protein
MRGIKPNFSYPDMDEEYGFFPRTIPDPGTGAAIPVLHSATVFITTGATGQTNTLAAPTFAGQVMLLNLVTDGGGDRVVTVADPHIDGTNNTVTMNDAGDAICLIGVKTSTSAFGWRLAWNVGCTLSHV